MLIGWVSNLQHGLSGLWDYTDLDITEKIIGASFEVHKFLGNGFPTVIYQRALAYELTLYGLAFEREIELQAWKLMII